MHAAGTSLCPLEQRMVALVFLQRSLPVAQLAMDFRQFLTHAQGHEIEFHIAQHFNRLLQRRGGFAQAAALVMQMAAHPAHIGMVLLFVDLGKLVFEQIENALGFVELVLLRQQPGRDTHAQDGLRHAGAAVDLQFALQRAQLRQQGLIGGIVFAQRQLTHRKNRRHIGAQPDLARFALGVFHRFLQQRFGIFGIAAVTQDFADIGIHMAAPPARQTQFALDFERAEIMPHGFFRAIIFAGDHAQHHQHAQAFAALILRQQWQHMLLTVFPGFAVLALRIQDLCLQMVE